MAQASSAQREPSMEEILASIRRIIEDSDTLRHPAGEDESGEPAGRADGPAVAAHEVEAFRAGLEEPAAPPPADPATDAPAARIDEERVSNPVPMADIHPIRGEHAMVEPAGTSEGAAGREMPAPPAAEPMRAASDLAAQATVDVRPAIISDDAGRQVAAAFGELSEAFAASRRRSFDELAQEMLRPMLQEWLDNNLPTLVEKLVREEIERVSRGG